MDTSEVIIAEMRKASGLAKDFDRSLFHDAFWQAFMILPSSVRTKFSTETGRNFANKIYDNYKAAPTNTDGE